MNLPTQRHSLYFIAPGQVEVRIEPLALPRPDEVVVETLVSAVSPGTEMLFYRGQVPAGMAVDTTIEALASELVYPLKYGYACAGRIVAVGKQVDATWLNRLVFAFHPHESHFCARPEALVPFLSDMHPDRAALLPNVETAVNLVMDGAPLFGEKVVVFGQGIVGLLVTQLLATFPLGGLFVVDPIAKRLAVAGRLGSVETFTPDRVDAGELAEVLGDDGADLVLELSGNPRALNQAIRHAGFGGRVVIGSWYGTKQAPLDLGGSFHRSRIQLISSQVSSIAPHLTGRWTKARRLKEAWRALAGVSLDALVTHRFPFTQAAQAYALIDQHPEQTIQVLLHHHPAGPAL